jgi:hypothetical protein
MMKRSVPALLYAGTSPRRWVQAAITTPDADLQNLCVWQWRRAAAIAASAGEENVRTLRVGSLDGVGAFR